ncbi:MAG: secretion system protein E [Thermoplasmata archaeon]|nr:MAG: secretion system protein E [Thermoplasmata archaeon]
MRVMVPRTEKEEVSAEVTPIPPITDENVQEIEIAPVEEGYSYVRINYDTFANEYTYEVIEPPLSEDEITLIEVLKEKIIERVEGLGEKVKKEEREQYLRDLVDKILGEMGVRLTHVVKERIMYYILRDFIGYGAIQVPMLDPEVEDISCDGVGIPIYIYHRKYGSIRSNLIFNTHHELDSFVVWLAQICGKHISVAEPMLDATMPDGSRLQETLGMHITKRGSSFTIRRFRSNPFTPIDLIRFKTMSVEMMAYLWIAIQYGSSAFVCGGTASGKTTTLNAILLFIPPQMKIVSIEDTRELNLPHENWIPALTRSGFGAKNPITGKAPGEIDMFDLLKAALRQRPQYIMVGEVRGAEAYTVFQAMATGKTSYSTFHAEDVQAMIHRLESDPINLPRALIAALDMVILQAQVKVGTKMTRRVKGIHEIVGLDPETEEIITNAAYTWNPADDTFNYSGHSYIYEKVRTANNWSPREMEREVKRRVDILNYMRKIGVKNYREVAKIVSAYYDHPDELMEEVERVLGK